MVAKPTRKNSKPIKELEGKKEKESEKDNGKEIEKKKEKDEENHNGKEKEDDKKDEVKQDGKENVKEIAKEDKRMIEKEVTKRRMTRTHKRTRIRIEESVVLKMTAMMVDGQVSKVDSIKVQCEDDLFGYESYTYLNFNDFEAVFSLGELSGAVVTSYMM
jgi:hypothetical protein